VETSFFFALLNKEPNVQVSDTTGDAMKYCGTLYILNKFFSPDRVPL